MKIIQPFERPVCPSPQTTCFVAMWLVFDVCKNQFKVDGRDGEMELGLWQVEGGEGGGGVCEGVGSGEGILGLEL